MEPKINTQVRKNHSFPNKMFVGLAICMAVVSLAAAGYYFGLFTDAQVITYSEDGKLTITRNIVSGDWFVNESLVRDDFLVIDNSNGQTAMNVSFVVSEINLDSANCNLTENDYTFVVKHSNGTEISDGDVITLPSGESMYFFNATAQERACPIQADITFELVEN